MDEYNKDSEAFIGALGGRPNLESRGKDSEDILIELIDKVNEVIELGNLVEGLTFRYVSPSGRTLAKLIITHDTSGKTFTIKAD
jgi:hypothetical protein